MKKLACIALVLSGCVVNVSPNSPPGAPLNVTAVAGNASATVTWSPGASGGAPITDFIVTISPGGFEYATAATSISVEGLANGVGYTFSVAAENSFGIGPASLSATIVPQGPAPDQQVSLGPQNFPGYHVKANAVTELPSGGIGYLVTANGSGGYRLFWADTLATGVEFSGTLTTDGTFNIAQTVQTGTFQLTQTGANQYAFDAQPGAEVQGFDVVSSTDPVYVDAKINGSNQNVAIYFTGATSGEVLVSSVNPVAFTSP